MVDHLQVLPQIPLLDYRPSELVRRHLGIVATRLEQVPILVGLSGFSSSEVTLNWMSLLAGCPTHESSFLTIGQLEHQGI